VRKAKTRLIAVEDGLTPVAAALRDKGYTVRSFTEVDLKEAEAIVVSGQDDDFLGSRLTHTRAPVIRAEGRAADEVVRDVEDRLGRLGV
jgi:hypothetical protein